MIKLNENAIIKGSLHNIELHIKKKKKVYEDSKWTGEYKEIFENEGYFSGLEGVLTMVLRDHVKTTLIDPEEIFEIKHVLAEIAQYKADLLEIVIVKKEEIKKMLSEK